MIESIEQSEKQCKNMFQAMRESFDIPKDWSIEESLKRVKEGVPGTLYLPSELIAAYVNLNRNEFSRYCTQVGRTTRQAKSLLTSCYGMIWEIARPCKPKPKPEPKRNKPSHKLRFATAWLLKYFRKNGKYALAVNCIYDAHKAGINHRTLQRAKDFLNVYCFSARGHWWWTLEQ